MRGSQKVLFADPRPLVERLGRDFFRKLPERPGVYLMRDAGEVALYVGKAKNLRKRLGSYRVANPERMPRRHLRMLRAVNRIELQECADEATALAKESELLRSLRPKFNRAGTWPAPVRHFAWQLSGDYLCLSVTEAANDQWRTYGPMGRAAYVLLATIARIVWAAMNPRRGFAGLPVGWTHGFMAQQTSIDCGVEANVVAGQIAFLINGQMGQFRDWFFSRMHYEIPSFEKTMAEAEFELLDELLRPLKQTPAL